MKIKKKLGLLVFLFSSLISQAQEVEMADDFRGEGKIYVVVAVVVTLMIGVFIQLFRLEKRLKALEKEKMKSNKPNG